MGDLLEFNYETKESLKEYESLFRNLLISTKKILGIKKNLSLSVNYIDKDKSKEINKQYRQKEYVGDVISFPINDEFGIYDQLDFKEIGDIFITFSEAQNKAKNYNHTIVEEMAWLFVHGLLHILGFDHETNEQDAKEMFKLTDDILKSENIKYIMSF
ncbi:rRNA maturation RNase YbeY [Spiroplasma floricola]|uniref:Endoribonuclease YbeY n=1 Tax=Spiroplasma floricola 23-6 TaxID=1336749 RepID=A0A2K8SEF4_9MOLU|nr:rRNA maturation RNase YbeY [Spiroplasma floricola]AUB31837.1 hypothetical protein SFLOR_v1c07890 [Spiroplasma floricola 23-6]